MTVALPPVVDGALIEAKLRCLLKFIGLETLQAPVTQLKSSPVEAQTTERITFTPGLPVPSRTFEIVKQGGDVSHLPLQILPEVTWLTLWSGHLEDIFVLLYQDSSQALCCVALKIFHSVR